MSYQPTVWEDRIVEKPRTFDVINNPDGSITLVPKPGVVVQEGTPVNAANMNKLEQGLAAHTADYVRQPAYAVTSGTSTAYTVTLDPEPATIPEGFAITIVPHVTCGANPTLNVNGKGATPLKNYDGTSFAAENLKAGRPYSFRKIGESFFIVGGTGEASFMTAIRSLSEDFQWNPKTNTPLDRNEEAFATIDNVVYAVGGYSTGYIASNYAYDFLTNTWATKASVPEARTGAEGVALGGLFYFIGGTKSDGSGASMQRFNPSTNSWTARAGISVLGGIGAATMNGLIYTVGGWFSSTTLRSYNPTSNAWTTRTSLPRAREYKCAVGVIEGKLHVVGGDNRSGSMISKHDVYDPVSDNWTYVTDSPAGWGRVAHGVVINGIFYAIRHDQIMQFDAYNSRWNEIGPMPGRHSWGTIAEYEGKLYVMGGKITDTTFTRVNEARSMETVIGYAKQGDIVYASGPVRCAGQGIIAGQETVVVDEGQIFTAVPVSGYVRR